MINPRYLGRQVAGRQRRTDELLDARDPALGTISRQRWQDRDGWSWSDEQSWPPLVSAELFEQVNKRITNTHGNNRRRPRAEPGRYLLAGMIRCGHCGKSMFGATMKGKPYYRCSATRSDYATPAVPGHPPSYSVREERILAKLDTWLATLGQPEQVDATVRSIVTADKSTGGEPGEVIKARRDRQRLQAELDRIITAIRADMDAKLAVTQTRELQTRIETATATIERWERSAE